MLEANEHVSTTNDGREEGLTEEGRDVASASG